MHQVLLTFILVCLGHWSSAQQNHYFKDNSRWVYQRVESYEPGQIFMYSGVEENTISGDTIIKGIQYKKLYKRFIHSNTTKPPFPHQGSTTTYYESKGPEFIRFDSTANMVFYRENVDSSEVVIYNFNATVGDTIALSIEYYNSNTVLKIDTISLFGIQHRMFVLDTNFIPVRNGIISGIGGLNGLTYNQPAFGALGGGILMTDLVCFEYPQSTFLSPWASYLEIPCPVSSDFLSSATDVKEDGVVVFPNPNKGSFVFKINESLLGSSLIIYNVNGSVIYSSSINQIQGEIVNLDAGFYIWHVITGEGKIHRKKIIVQ